MGSMMLTAGNVTGGWAFIAVAIVGLLRCLTHLIRLSTGKKSFWKWVTGKRRRLTDHQSGELSVALLTGFLLLFLVAFCILYFRMKNANEESTSRRRKIE